MNSPHDDLSPPEQAEIKRLATEVTPPASLEDRIVQKLRSQGLIRSKDYSWTRYLALAAAGIVLFVVGIIAGRNWPLPANPDPRSQFVLMLYEDSNYQTASPAELPGRVAEYGRWAQSLGGGNYVRGQKLVQSESTVSPSGIVGPTAPTEKPGSVAGYFVIRASNPEEAARIASTCPHVRYGGVVSVREVER